MTLFIAEGTAVKIIRTGENTLEAKRQADRSQAWAVGTLPGGAGTKSAKEWSEASEGFADDAALSAAYAESMTGPTYASTAAGLAATTNGQAFAVDAGGGLVSVYLNSAGTAVLQRTLATTAYLASSAGAGAVGFIQAGTGAVVRSSEAKLQEIVSVDDYGAVGDGVVDDRAAILAAIEYAASLFSWVGQPLGNPGCTIIGRPGATYRYSGRIRLRPGVALDFGRGAAAAHLVAMDATGGIEVVAGASLVAELRAEHAAFTGPMLELNSAKSTELSFGRNERLTWLDVGVRGNRQPNSVGILMTDDTGGGGVAWVQGKVSIGEVDFPCDLVSNGTGYVNENWLDLQIFDGVENVRMLVNGTGEVAANHMRITTQTGTNGRSGFNLKCDGRCNIIDIVCWDWTTARLNPAYDGTQILLTEKSGGNIIRGFAARQVGGFYKPAVIDLAPQIRRNFVEVNDLRVVEPDTRPTIPNGYFNCTMTGDQDDELAFAGNGRWTVTGGGATPPDADDLKNLFQPNGVNFAIDAATEATVTVDFGTSKYGTDFNGIGLLFAADATKPDKVKIEASTDGTTWATVLSAGYDGGPVPSILHRMDGGGLSNFRYLRLTAENTTPKNLRIARWFLSCHGTAKTGGAWLPKYRPIGYGRFDVKTEFSGDGYWVNGTKVVTTRRTGWTADTGTAKRTANATYSGTAEAAYTQATIQTLMNAVRDISQTVKALKDDMISHGLIGS